MGPMRTTDVVDRPWRSGTLACVAMMGWLSVVLWLDRAAAGGGLAQQRLLGVATWLVLLVALRRVSPHGAGADRRRGGLRDRRGVRLQPDPRGLPLPLRQRPDVRPARARPGLPVGVRAGPRARSCERHLRACTAAVLVVGGLWAGYGLFLAERPDALGAFWFACLVGFLLRGPSTPVYVGAFVVVSYLELVGTAARHLGVAEPGPHRLGLDRQPAFGRRGRLRLVRPGRAAGGAVPRGLVRPPGRQRTGRRRTG